MQALKDLKTFLISWPTLLFSLTFSPVSTEREERERGTEQNSGGSEREEDKKHHHQCIKFLSLHFYDYFNLLTMVELLFNRGWVVGGEIINVRTFFQSHESCQPR